MKKPTPEEIKSTVERARRTMPHQLMYMVRQALEAWERSSREAFAKEARASLKLLYKLLEAPYPPMKTKEEARLAFEKAEKLVTETCEPLREGDQAIDLD